MRATAHTPCCWHLPTILMVVYHIRLMTADQTIFISAEACRSTPAHSCMVATSHQIAPWTRGSDLLSPTTVGAAFRSTSVGGGLAHSRAAWASAHLTATQIE